MNNLDNKNYFDDNDLFESLSSNKKWTSSKILRFQIKYELSNETLIEIKKIFSFREKNISKFFIVLEKNLDKESLKNILENISDEKIQEIFLKLWLNKKEISENEIKKFLEFIKNPFLNSLIFNFKGDISWFIK